MTPRAVPTVRALALAASWLALAVPTLSTAALDAGPWPMFHRNPGHTAMTIEAAPSSGAIAWSVALSDTVEFSSPVMSSRGLILLGDQGKELWAFDPLGNPVWDYHTDGNLRYGSAAVASDGGALIGAGDGRLYCLDSSNGRFRWSHGVGGAIKTSPAVAADGTIYFGADDGYLYALYPSGSLKWTFATADTIRSSPAIGSDGTVYFGSHDGNLYAVWPDGTLRWQAATGGMIRSAPAVYRQNVIVASGDGFLYSFTEYGAFNWATFTDQNLRSSPAIGVTGKIYLGVDTKIACFHDDGDPSYEFDTGGRVLSSPAVAMTPDSVDIVVCGSDDGKVYAVRDGVLYWEATLGAPVRSSPMIGPHGQVYVGAMNGRLYAIGTLDPTGADGLGAAGAPRLAVEPNPGATGGPVRLRLIGWGESGSGAVRAGSALTVHDAAGRMVRSLGVLMGGAVVWDGRDDRGRDVPAGIYLVRWTDGARRASARAVRLR